jgi:HSP20 family molecular chaperone IbpA
MSSERQFSWMWAQACELLERAERLQRQFVRYVGPGSDAGVWEPPVDIQVTAGEPLVVFAIPGVEPEQIKVSLEPGALTVSALRPLRLASRNAVIRRLEIPHGRFVRRVPLSGNPVRLVESHYINGCLEVRLTSGSVNPIRG